MQNGKCQRLTEKKKHKPKPQTNNPQAYGVLLLLGLKEKHRTCKHLCTILTCTRVISNYCINTQNKVRSCLFVCFRIGTSKLNSQAFNLVLPWNRLSQDYIDHSHFTFLVVGSEWLNACDDVSPSGLL